MLRDKQINQSIKQKTVVHPLPPPEISIGTISTFFSLNFIFTI